jgi:hypothetical protein
MGNSDFISIKENREGHYIMYSANKILGLKPAAHGIARLSIPVATPQPVGLSAKPEQNSQYPTESVALGRAGKAIQANVRDHPAQLDVRAELAQVDRTVMRPPPTPPLGQIRAQSPGQLIWAAGPPGFPRQAAELLIQLASDA